MFWIGERVNPYEVDIDRNQIEARYLFGKTRRFNSGAILSIIRERQVRRIRYTAKMIVYPIVITFENGERWQLEEGRIWVFGYSPDRLFAILKKQLKRSY